MPTYRLPDGLAGTGDPVDGNPFSEEDPRHAVWNEGTREAEQEVARINEGFLSSLARLDPVQGGVMPWFAALETHAAKFDTWAKRAIKIVWSDEAMHHYDSWLVRYANARIDATEKAYASAPSIVPVEDLLTRLRAILASRVEYWKAEARRYRADQERRIAIGPETKRESAAEPYGWEDVLVTFVSDKQLQLKVKGRLLEPQNYSEMGFVDRKTGNPIRAWGCLQRLAEGGGEPPKPSPSPGNPVAKLEKRVQEIRKKLREHLNRQGVVIPDDSDPLPCVDGTYRAAFRIETAKSYHG